MGFVELVGGGFVGLGLLGWLVWFIWMVWLVGWVSSVGWLGRVGLTGLSSPDLKSRCPLVPFWGGRKNLKKDSFGRKI